MGVLVFPVLGVLISGAWGWDLRMQTRHDLINQGAILSLVVAGLVQQSEVPAEDIRARAPHLGVLFEGVRKETLAGIRLVDATGVVVAGSDVGAIGADLSGEVEVSQALAGRVAGVERPRPDGRVRPSILGRGGEPTLASLSRFSPVRVFIAVPVVSRGEVIGAVVLSRTPREELQALYQMSPRLIWGAAFALVLTVGVATVSARVLSRTLVRLVGVSEHLRDARFDGAADLDRAAVSRVAEVARLAEAMRAMSERLRDRMRYISEFAGNVSHEFRTPLATLRGTVELLRDDPQMPSEQRERFLENAATDLERLTRLVQGLLELAQAEEGQGSELVGLDSVMAEVAARVPRVVVNEGGGIVRGSAQQLETAVHNLVRNAMEHGGSDVRIDLSGWVEPGWTGVDVIDDGPGIVEANLPRVFDRFFTTGRDQGGTGLGLAIVAAIARAHGGDVEVQSRPGSTRFRIRLPAVT